MNLDTLEDRIDKSQESNDELASLYIGILNLESFLSAMKSAIMEHVEHNLIEANLNWGESDMATFGITQPTPKSKVDESAWRAAVLMSEELRALEVEYERARMSYLTDATQMPRPYIHKKKGVE